MSFAPGDLNDSAVGRLFLKKQAEGSATWFSVPGGSPLYAPGDESDCLYMVKTGRLGAFRREEGQETQFLGLIRPGEPAGEMAMIAGTQHSGSVVALRDSEVLALPREDFFAAADHEPAVMIELARLMIARSRQAATKASAGSPAVFGFVADDPEIHATEFVHQLAAEVSRFGHSATVVGAESLNAPTEWFSNVERDHELVLYVAEFGQTAWRYVVGRQVDRLFRMARGTEKPPRDQKAPILDPLHAQRLVDLILIQRPLCVMPSGSAAWLEATGAARLFHVRYGDVKGIQRMARVITGRSVGLVLSGGGARAYAQIGAIRALEEASVPIDFVGGVSMGAVIGAGLAKGWSLSELDQRIRKAFVNSSPLDDIAVPILAMTLGLKVDDRLQEHFDEIEMPDLWLPFFCLSSNLTSGAYHLHQRGRLRSALRASISLPGVLPPVTLDNNVLVDGAVMKNFPADIMRSMHLGPVVGVDVTRGRSLDGHDVVRPKSWWRWLWSGEWRKGPPIVALLMRAATVTSGRDLLANREATDLLITPMLDGIDIRDWRAFDGSVAEGYEVTRRALAALSRPVTDLRRHNQAQAASSEGLGGRPDINPSTVSIADGQG